MQSVIELGRVVRDRKTMPVKYPLPELVIIHKDQVNGGFNHRLQ
jgi:isoleucyl-tRNA synthetase